METFRGFSEQKMALTRVPDQLQTRELKPCLASSSSTIVDVECKPETVAISSTNNSDKEGTSIAAETASHMHHSTPSPSIHPSLSPFLPSHSSPTTLPENFNNFITININQTEINKAKYQVKLIKHKTHTMHNRKQLEARAPLYRTMSVHGSSQISVTPPIAPMVNRRELLPPPRLTEGVVGTPLLQKNYTKLFAPFFHNTFQGAAGQPRLETFFPTLNKPKQQKTSSLRRPNCPKEDHLYTYSAKPKDYQIIETFLHTNYCKNLLNLKYNNPQEFTLMHANLPRNAKKRGIRSKEKTEKKKQTKNYKETICKKIQTQFLRGFGPGTVQPHHTSN